MLVLLEGAGTLETFEGPFAGVRADVLFQRGSMRERFVAVRALQRLLPQMHVFDMVIQRRTRLHLKCLSVP